MRDSSTEIFRNLPRSSNIM